jgi:hypothetical protein
MRTLVHEFGRKQPETIKELLEIATRHTSGEEAVGATFTLVQAVTTIGEASQHRRRRHQKGC